MNATVLAQYLPFGLKFDDVIVAMAGLAAVLTVLAIWSVAVPHDPLAAKARALVERRMALKAAATSPVRRRQSLRAVGIMRTVVMRLNLLRSLRAETMTLKLARAGNRSHDAMIAYLFAKVAMPVACAALAGFMIFVARVYDGPIAARLLIVVVALGVGAYLPDLYVRNAADKRRKKLQKALPDALDLMVICTEAGLSLDATLQRVSQEFGKSSPELADEFSLTAVELGFLPERRKALDNLSARTDLAALRAMCNTLLQTEKYGTPLAHSLRVLAAELRTERMMKAEEKAARLPAILTVPMIIFILPPLFIVLIGPAILNTIDALSAL